VESPIDDVLSFVYGLQGGEVCYKVKLFVQVMLFGAYVNLQGKVIFLKSGLPHFYE
jgi:hypothetical protein